MSLSYRTATMTTDIVSFDVGDLIQLLQVHLPQLRLETIAYEHKAQMEDNKEQYHLLCKEADSLRKKLSSVLQDNDACRKAQERMEAQIYAQQQELAEAQKEIQLLTKQKRDLEKRLEIELHNYESDRLMWHQRETELCSELKRRAQDSWRNHGQPRRTRSATASNVWNRDNLAAEETQKWNEHRISALQVKDIKTRAQERLLADFAAQVEQQKRIIQDAILTTEAQASRVEELEKELFSVKQLNASLMEDNECYQTLLREKTMTGDFLKNVEEEDEEEGEEEGNQTTTLAAELGKTTSEMDSSLGNQNDTVTKLAEEVRILQESNKALTLYMNKILLKIVDNQELVDVLNIDVDEDEQQTYNKSNDRKQPQKQSTSVDSSVIKPTEQSNLSAQSNSRPRRSTISSWITAPKQSLATESPTIAVRHRSQTNAALSTSGGGGWSRALKRMTAVL